MIAAARLNRVRPTGYHPDSQEEGATQAKRSESWHDRLKGNKLPCLLSYRASHLMQVKNSKKSHFLRDSRFRNGCARFCPCLAKVLGPGRPHASNRLDPRLGPAGQKAVPSGKSRANPIRELLEKLLSRSARCACGGQMAQFANHTPRTELSCQVPEPLSSRPRSAAARFTLKTDASPGNPRGALRVSCRRMRHPPGNGPRNRPTKRHGPHRCLSVMPNGEWL